MGLWIGPSLPECAGHGSHNGRIIPALVEMAGTAVPMGTATTTSDKEEAAETGHKTYQKKSDDRKSYDKG